MIKRSDPVSLEAQAEALLWAWSSWVKDPVLLGLPRQSVTETANMGGVMRGSPRAPSDMPDDVALTDRAVAALGLRHRSILRRFIFLRYERGLPLEGIREATHLSMSQVRALRDRSSRAVWRHRLMIA